MHQIHGLCHAGEIQCIFQSRISAADHSNNFALIKCPVTGGTVGNACQPAAGNFQPPVGSPCGVDHASGLELCVILQRCGEVSVFLFQMCNIILTEQRPQFCGMFPKFFAQFIAADVGQSGVIIHLFCHGDLSGTHGIPFEHQCL